MVAGQSNNFCLYTTPSRFPLILNSSRCFASQILILLWMISGLLSRVAYPVCKKKKEIHKFSSTMICAQFRFHPRNLSLKAPFLKSYAKRKCFFFFCFIVPWIPTEAYGGFNDERTSIYCFLKNDHIWSLFYRLLKEFGVFRFSKSA